jgi:threonine aldolase
MNVIDLRSDTVSHPTPQMREAMANAVVGDDVYGEDPTVIQLERDAAQMLGFEAGLFVTSGTQGNLIALLTHCERGSEAIVGDKAHTFVYEAGGMSALGGIMPHIVKVHDDGHIDLDDIRHAIRGDNYHFPRTRLISIENTQGTVGGLPLSPSYMHSVAELAHAHGLIFHVDGARIFNASTAYNVPIDEMVRGADSVTFCLSKGLCAPAGSILVGSQAFIAEARRTRKLLGGGMRQVGILAAAGLLAIHEMSKRLHIDHENAAYLAEGLSDVPHIQVASNATNFVFFWLQESAKLSPNQFNQALAQRHILMSPYPGFERKYRCVTHYWITKDKIDEVLHAMKEILA